MTVLVLEMLAIEAISTVSLPHSSLIQFHIVHRNETNTKQKQHLATNANGRIHAKWSGQHLTVGSANMFSYFNAWNLRLPKLFRIFWKHSVRKQSVLEIPTYFEINPRRCSRVMSFKRKWHRLEKHRARTTLYILPQVLDRGRRRYFSSTFAHLRLETLSQALTEQPDFSWRFPAWFFPQVLLPWRSELFLRKDA